MENRQTTDRREAVDRRGLTDRREAQVEINFEDRRVGSRRENSRRTSADRRQLN